MMCPPSLYFAKKNNTMNIKDYNDQYKYSTTYMRAVYATHQKYSYIYNIETTNNNLLIHKS